MRLLYGEIRFLALILLMKNSRPHTAQVKEHFLPAAGRWDLATV